MECVEVISILCFAGRIPLHHCTSPGVAELLVARDADSVSIADTCGLLPAHYAVMRNSFGILSVLVQQQGATGVDSRGMQPLHYAVMWVCVWYQLCGTATVDVECTWARSGLGLNQMMWSCRTAVT